MRQSAGNSVAKRLSAIPVAHETKAGPLAAESACVARVRSPLLLKTTSYRPGRHLGSTGRLILSIAVVNRVMQSGAAPPGRAAFLSGFPLVGGARRGDHLLWIKAHGLLPRMQWDVDRTPSAAVAIPATDRPKEERWQTILFDEVPGARFVACRTAATLALEPVEEKSPKSGAGKGEHEMSPRAPEQSNPKADWLDSNSVGCGKLSTHVRLS
jgi:hypothetical protein